MIRASKLIMFFYRYYENPKINLHIPPFGYEQFLQSLVDNYIRLIWLDRNVYLFLENILQENCREKLKRRLTSAESAKIKVYNTKVNYYISLRYKKLLLIWIFSILLFLLPFF